MWWNVYKVHTWVQVKILSEILLEKHPQEIVLEKSFKLSDIKVNDAHICRCDQVARLLDLIIWIIYLFLNPIADKNTLISKLDLQSN